MYSKNKKLKYVILRKKSKHTKISKLCTSDFVSPLASYCTNDRQMDRQTDRHKFSLCKFSSELAPGPPECAGEPSSDIRSVSSLLLFSCVL